MSYEFVTLSDISIGGGSYGIAASAVPYSDSLPAYLKITGMEEIFMWLFLSHIKTIIEFSDIMLPGKLICKYSTISTKPSKTT